jgi:hypothetical protein
VARWWLAFTLTVNGDHFVKSSTVLWNNVPRPTTYLSSIQLTAQIPASDVMHTGNANVEVSNPAPCGGISNAQRFTILGD